MHGVCDAAATRMAMACRPMQHGISCCSTRLRAAEPRSHVAYVHVALCAELDEEKRAGARPPKRGRHFLAPDAPPALGDTRVVVASCVPANLRAAGAEEARQGRRRAPARALSLFSPLGPPLDAQREIRRRALQTSNLVRMTSFLKDEDGAMHAWGNSYAGAPYCSVCGAGRCGASHHILLVQHPHTVLALAGVATCGQHGIV
jgi:hypothetical protein